MKKLVLSIVTLLMALILFSTAGQTNNLLTADDDVGGYHGSLISEETCI